MIHWICIVYKALTMFATQHPGVLFLAVSSAIFAMPAKDSQWSWRLIYAFFYDWFHGWIGMRYPQSSAQVTITPSKTEASSTTTEQPLPKQP